MNSARRRTLLMVTAMVWIVAYAAYTTGWMLEPMPFVLERALRRIPICLFGAACCWAIGALLDRASGRPGRRQLVLAVLLCIPAAFAYGLVNTLIFYVLAPVWGHVSGLAVLQAVIDVIWVFFAWTALYFAITSDAEARDSKLRLADAQTEALRARNQALVQQLSPHFLFNALNTVTGLIGEGESVRAERVTIALAGLLRNSLNSEPRELVPLSEEIDLLNRYLEIEESRFEDRLIVEERMPSELGKLSVPPMILQPLVENAVKHGVARSIGLVRLTIAADLEGDRLRLSICDDARVLPTARASSGNGIGQENVRQRLALLYGASASLRCAPQLDGGYCAEIELPAETYVGD